MSYIEDLRRHRADSNSIFHRFRLSYSARPDLLHCFFEGEDDCAFFGVHIRRLIELDVESYVCHGKKGVVALFKKIGETYGQTTGTAFFVDKDYDQLVGEDPLNDLRDADKLRIFESDGYSIENYFDDINVVWRILVETYGVPLQANTMPELTTQYERCRRSFFRALMPYMAIYLAGRRCGFRLNLNNVKTSALLVMSEYFTVRRTPSGVRRFIEATSTADERRELTRSSVKAALRDLRKVPEREATRGKYVIWCLLGFVDKVFEQARSAGAIQRRRAVLNERGFVAVIADKCGSPPRLENYLRSCTYFHLPKN